jgi:hypothetical protein
MALPTGLLGAPRLALRVAAGKASGAQIDLSVDLSDSRGHYDYRSETVGAAFAGSDGYESRSGSLAFRWIAETPDDQKFVGQFAVGDMLIAYGYPSVIQNNYVGLNPSLNLRAIKAQWYRTDILDYGRPGGASKVLRTAW